ncbi:MAG: translocation/assembly module TamB domain-containing protein [Dysgonomonas sp.]|nr:translocation/assembly module TamB domain-containing protein [Dysgonomonas sp.]
MQAVQNYVKDIIVEELKNRLNTDLDIGTLSIQPFNIIQLNDIYLKDRQDSVILVADKVYADFELLSLLNNRLIISSARLDDFQLNLSKDSTEAPLNIQFVIDAFKSKDNTPKTKLEVKINSINLADGHFRFDVKNKEKLANKFDPNHIDISNLNAKLSLKSINPDSLNIQIKKLELQEQSGLEIKNLIVRVVTQENHLSVKGFKLSLPKSLLQFDKCEIDYSGFNTPADFLDNAFFETKISSSYVTLKDISALVPALEHFQERILFKTEVSGKLDSIQVNNIKLDYGEKMHLSAQGFVANIRDKERTYIRGKLSEFTVTKDGIIGILNNLSKEKKTPPPILDNIGKLSFIGNVNGYLKHLKAEGSLSSELGTITANAIFGLEARANERFFFDGMVETKSFKLGSLLKNEDIGDISFNVSANITQPKKGEINGTVKGLVEDFTFKKYTYHNIVIDGKYDGLQIDGGLSVDDPNGILKISGLFDLSSKEPKLDFFARLKNVRLDNLNLSNKYKEAYLGFAIDANFSGKNIDDIEGYIKADSISFLHAGKILRMNKFLIEAKQGGETQSLNVQSDIINGKVSGVYSFTTIVESFKRTFSNYLPALVTYNAKNDSKIKVNDLDFDFTINNTEEISSIFKLPVTIYSPTKIAGFYNNQTERFKLEAFMPSLSAGGGKIQSGYLILQNNDENINANISASFVTKKGTVNDLSTSIIAQNDNIDLKTSFLNENENQLKGIFSNTVHFSKQENNILQTEFRFHPGELILNNTLWKIQDSQIRLTGSRIEVQNFAISSDTKDQLLTIEGVYSPKEENENLDIHLKNIDLEYIFSSLAIDALQFSGAATGDIIASSIKGQPYAEVNLNVHDFGFNQTTLGDLKLFSDLDTETLKVNMKGNITNENNKLTNIDGFINPINSELSINFDAEEVNVAFLNKYVSTLFNNVKGSGSGHVHLFGNFSKVTVEGEAYIENGGIGINFLNTNYSFTDTIVMKEDLIYFSDIDFHDEKGNIAKVSGRVAHDYFSNFMYYVDLNGENFMVYNAPEKLNPMFYGTVFATGTGVIKGDETAVDLNMNLRTDRNTSVYMNFMEEAAAEYSFITYKTDSTETDSITGITTNRFKPNRFTTDSGIEMNMNFYIDATPDASVEFLMDPVGGDRLKGSGSGALQFVWGSNKDPMLYGTYQITKGSYNFTFQKILERKFNIQEGSSVQFRGDPFQANIDITAVYRVTANLNDLDRNLAMTTGQTSVPVNCLLNITGPLRHPNVNLDVELPSADPEVQRQVKSLMSTEDMINRQIVYLLLLSKFYTPSYAVTDQKTSDFAAVASATLSAQLSKVLSQIDDRWQIGTNIRTSDSEFSNTEVELLLSSRLLNDRVLFNGNFGYRDNVTTSDAFIGDIDIEVLLNRMGTWRLKAYNHYNEKYYYVRSGGSVQTQGIGIIYKKDFDNLRDLFGVPQKTRQPIVIDTIPKQDTIPPTTSQFVIMKK